MSDIYRRCGCRDEAGRQYGARCPQLKDPKHGTWAYYLAAGVDPKTGKRRQVRQAGFATKQAAQKARNEIAVKLDRGNYVKAAKVNLADYLDAWLPRRRTTGKGLKPVTVMNYRRYIDLDIKPTELGRMMISDIRRNHINAFVQDLVRAGRGATTVRRIAAVLQSALRDAADEDRIDHNPARGIQLPQVTKAEFSPWSPEQVGLFLDHAARRRLGPLFEVAVFTGLRRSELCGLHWADVDLAARELTVRSTRVQAGKEVVETTPKSKAGRRVVELDEAASSALLSWRLAQDLERSAWGGAYADRGFVFTYENGEPLRPPYVSKVFDQIRDEAALPHISFHGLRHEHASLMLSSGADIAVISKRLGHSTLSLTSDTYAHLIASASRRAAENAAALVPRGGAGAHTLHSQGDEEQKTKTPESATSA